MKTSVKLPLGVKVIIGFHLLSILLWLIGQGGAVVAYDTVAGWGLQPLRELVNPAIVEVNRAIGLTDIIVQMPLFILGVLGLLRLEFYGAVSSWMVFSISFYWPLEFLFSEYFYKQAGIRAAGLSPGLIIFPLLIALFAIWGCRYLYTIRNQLK